MSVSPPRDAPPELACPRCGTTYAPNQEYCLECGLRLPVEAHGVVPRLGRAWRRRVAWYPGDWIWPSLLALVIAALAGLGAGAFVSHDRGVQYVDGTSPVSPVTSTLTPPETNTQTTTPKTKPKRHATPPPPTAPAAPKNWPAGQSGYTVVLQSLPTTNGRSFALAQARAALHAGVPGVGILDSSQFSSLHPGYYVLFSGVYQSFDDANAALTTVQSHGYPRAYPRRITP